MLFQLLGSFISLDMCHRFRACDEEQDEAHQSADGCKEYKPQLSCIRKERLLVELKGPCHSRQTYCSFRCKKRFSYSLQLCAVQQTILVNFISVENTQKDCRRFSC